MPEKQFDWDDSCSVGNSKIDSQHKTLLGHVSDIINQKEDYDIKKFRKMLNEMLEYVESHFSDEERWMREIGYPLIDEQVNEHKKLSRVMHSYRRDFESGNTDLYQFKQFLINLVEDHFRQKDMKIAEYVKSER